MSEEFSLATLAKIAEAVNTGRFDLWGSSDELGMLQQLGVFDGFLVVTHV
jgi:hypothetical protein